MLAGIEGDIPYTFDLTGVTVFRAPIIVATPGFFDIFSIDFIDNAALTLQDHIPALNTGALVLDIPLAINQHQAT